VRQGDGTIFGYGTPSSVWCRCSASGPSPASSVTMRHPRDSKRTPDSRQVLAQPPTPMKQPRLDGSVRCARDYGDFGQRMPHVEGQFESQSLINRLQYWVRQGPQSPRNFRLRFLRPAGCYYESKYGPCDGRYRKSKSIPAPQWGPHGPWRMGCLRRASNATRAA
jgi:hypothetical protein